MQTLTIREAETQLQHLVTKAQNTHQPFILTDDVAAPMAVLTPVVAEKPDQDAALARRLEILESVIQMWQQHCADPDVSRDAAQLLQSQLRQLGLIDGHRPSVFRGLIMLLRLATRLATIPTPPNQVQALALGINALRISDLTWQDVEKVDKEFLINGIDVRANFGDEELLNSYVDAS